MALTRDDLTTVERVKALLKNVPTGLNPQIEDDIHDYSRAAIDYTGREFRSAPPAPDDVEERKFVYLGTSPGYLNLEPSEAREITEVRVYAGTHPVQVVDVAYWRGMPVNKSPEDTFLWLKLHDWFWSYLDTPFPESWLGDYVIGVVGKWGTASVPPAASRAVAIACAHAYRSPEGFQRRSLSGGFDLGDEAELDTEQPGLSLPRDARAMLRPYQRPNAKRRHGRVPA